MNDNQDKQELIDRYLLGDMDENESAAFEKCLTIDSDLREETELSRHVITAFQKEGEQAAIEAMKSVSAEMLQQWITSSPPTVGHSRRRSLYISVSTAAAAIILFVLYTGTRPLHTSEYLFTQYYQTQPYEVFPVRGGSELNLEERTWIRQAETYYRQADYASALSLYNRLFALRTDRESLPEEVIFYSAICRLETNDLSGAIETLECIVSDETSGYRNDAIWNLAFAYLKDGKREKTKTCFEILIKSENEYTEKAIAINKIINKRKFF